MGEVSRDEFFKTIMSNPRARAYLSDKLGIDMFQAAHTFRMIDTDNSGTLDKDEFVIGCLRFRGGASAIEIEMNLRETRRIQKDIGRLRSLVVKLTKLVQEDLIDSVQE